MLRHAVIVVLGLLVTACATVPVGGPTAPAKDPDAGQLTLPSGRNIWIYPRDLAFTGTARYTWPSGDTYEGQWEKGQPHGMGTMELTTGELYRGMWEHGKRQGHGELTLPEGNHYVGDFVDGVRQGEGAERSAEGLYRGNWNGSLPDGEGEFHGDDGSSYEGDWSAGQRQGYGKFTDANGNTYEGDWFADSPHGFGSMSGVDGDSYEGSWSQGRRDGYGTATDVSGLRYEGTWVDGKRDGYGVVTRPDGSRYEGEWKNDKRQGQGRETASDGSFHDGGWDSNQPLGPGTRHNSAGIEISGVWNGDTVNTGLLILPTGQEYAGPLFKNHNEEASLQLRDWLTEIATQGDPYAQMFLGTLYSDFKQPAPDVDQARRWYGKASRAGLAEAQYRLALTYAERNVPRTIELLAQAAEQNHAAANDLLGEYYLTGDKVPRNLETAIRYFERAIAAGSVQAHNNLAWLLATTNRNDLRDGKRAIALIRPIALLYESWQYLDTLAAAYAASADFKQAISMQQRALEDAADGEDVEPAIVAEMQQRLSAYQQHQPARE